MPRVKKKLGEILIDSGLISEAALSEALTLQKNTGEKLGQILINNGFTTNAQIIDAVKKQLGIQEINLDNVNIRQEVINILPESIARKYDVLPVDVINGQLMVTMADPLNYFALEDIRITTGYAVIPAISMGNTILEGIERYYGKSRAEEAAHDYHRVYGTTKISNKNEMFDDEESAPIIKFINTIIENAILNNASDIHIEPEEKQMRVRIRVDGFLRELMSTDMNMLYPIVSRIKILGNLNIAETRIPQDGRIDFKARQKNIDLRVSIVPTIWGEKVVMRILDKSSFLVTLDKVGLSNEDMKNLQQIISKPHGIMLVAGPTGSGKTTTLYSILNILNDVSKNIITIEDPVEYNLKGIYQMQVNNKIDFTFANGLRSILRQDPDIILVGEIRDQETAEISVRSALTGHLVLSSIHTNSAVGSITRLLDMGIKPFLLSSTIVGVISQRLVRKVCSQCSEEYSSSSSEMRILGVKSPVKLVKGRGCSACNNTGYRGRTGVFEVLTIDREIRDLIDTEQSETVIEEKASQKGMILLRDSCIRKVLAGETTIDEMLRVTFGY